MDDDIKLTKKEKRELAKEEKAKTREKSEWTGRLKKIGVVVIIAAVVFGLFKLLSAPQKVSSKLGEKFETYANELGLDVEQFKQDIQSSESEGKVTQDIASGNSFGVNATPTFYLNGEKIQPGSYDEFKAFVEKVKNGEKENSMEVKVNDNVKGSREAKAVLIEYSDFQCPACQVYYPVVKQLTEELGNEILVVYRHFPLTTIHPNALPAAKAAEAAGKQGKFWEMHDMLFDKQSEWSALR